LKGQHSIFVHVSIKIHSQSYADYEHRGEIQHAHFVSYLHDQSFQQLVYHPIRLRPDWSDLSSLNRKHFRSSGQHLGSCSKVRSRARWVHTVALTSVSTVLGNTSAYNASTVLVAKARWSPRSTNRPLVGQFPSSVKSLHVKWPQWLCEVDICHTVCSVVSSRCCLSKITIIIICLNL